MGISFAAFNFDRMVTHHQAHEWLMFLVRFIMPRLSLPVPEE